MKRKLMALMLVLTAAAMPVAAYAAEYPCGDADADKSLTASDASVIMQKVLDDNYTMPIETVVSDSLSIAQQLLLASGNSRSLR